MSRNFGPQVTTENGTVNNSFLITDAFTSKYKAWVREGPPFYSLQGIVPQVSNLGSWVKDCLRYSRWYYMNDGTFA